VRSSSGQRLKRFSTEKHRAVWPLDKVELLLFQPSVEHARGGPGKGGGCLDREHHGFGSAFLAVQEDAVSGRQQDRNILAFYRDFNVPCVLQIAPYSCGEGPRLVDFQAEDERQPISL